MLEAELIELQENKPKRLVNATLRLAHDVDPELFRHLTGHAAI